METRSTAEPVGPQLHGIRRHRRYLFSVPVQVHLMIPKNRSARGMSLEISEGGMSAVLEGELRVGEIAAVELPLPAGSLSALAIVRHKGAGHFGFEFLGLTANEREQLKQSAKSLQSQRGTLLNSLGV
jgi:c-di-GMP-binding flagellar brake protein YcgR